MEKRLMLLTSLLVAGGAATPLVHQEKNTNQTSMSIQGIFGSLDLINLTMNDSIPSTEVALPILKDLLNEQLTLSAYNLRTSTLALINKDSIRLKWENTDLDNSILRSLLESTLKIDEVTLSVWKAHPVWNVVTAYFHIPAVEEDYAISIGLFDWSGHDMSSYWTDEVKFEFDLYV